MSIFPNHSRVWWRLLTAALFITFSSGEAFSQRQEGDAGDLRQAVTAFFKRQASVRYIYQVAIRPDGEAIAWSADGPDGSQVINSSRLSASDKTLRITARTAKNKYCSEVEPQWSPDGSEIAFLSDARTPGQQQVFVANAATGALLRNLPLTKFDGYVSHLKWSPDGKYLSVLYVEKASREPSPMAAKNKMVGLIDSALNRNVQRIAVINRASGKMEQATPANFYVFEYDWSPDSRELAYTAAVPPGDDNWYIAGLYQQKLRSGDTVLVYNPEFQIALPRWSPDGKHIAFIEGLMSDQGGTGGEIYMIATTGHDSARNLTPRRPSTPSWFAWRPDGSMIFTEFTGGSVAINTLNTSSGTTTRIWKGDASIRAGNEEMSLAIGGTATAPAFAFSSSSWDKLPEIYFGTAGNLRQVSHLNRSISNMGLKAEDLVWTNEGQPVQGWLLYPAGYSPAKRYPMLVCVHGGPAWITTPTWSAPDFNTSFYTQLGYFVFFPNPRGSLGQGEAFTKANRRDWGFGDLRDIVSGVDTITRRFSVDSNRIGILGWSYGGSMSMFAVTQTNKFRAAVAGAAAADWLSYYGQNAIDKWMWSYFGTSPYDDPAAYARSSAMTYIKRVKTPTLILVGELDGEAPAPQSFQFWHALKELRVPTQLMVYEDEGHSFSKFENMIDVSVRTIEWFNRYMPPDNGNNALRP